MNTLITGAIALGLLATATVANASEMTGRVMTTDPATNTVIMEDGTVLELVNGLSVQDLAPGTKVVVTYDEKDGKNMVTDIAPAS